MFQFNQDSFNNFFRTEFLGDFSLALLGLAEEIKESILTSKMDTIHAQALEESNRRKEKHQKMMAFHRENFKAKRSLKSLKNELDSMNLTLQISQKEREIAEIDRQLYLSKKEEILSNVEKEKEEVDIERYLLFLAGNAAFLFMALELPVLFLALIVINITVLMKK